MATWYSVVRDKYDKNWNVGSDNLDDAKEILADQCSDDGLIAVIENGICTKMLHYKDLYDVALVVRERRKCDGQDHIVTNEQEADRLWDHLSKQERKEAAFFYLCRAYIYNGAFLSEIEELKKYK